MTYNKHINVALAVAMPDGGLITPVIKDADATDIYQVRRLAVDSTSPAGPCTVLCTYSTRMMPGLGSHLKSYEWPVVTASHLQQGLLQGATQMSHSTSWAL